MWLANALVVLGQPAVKRNTECARDNVLLLCGHVMQCPISVRRQYNIYDILLIVCMTTPSIWQQCMPSSLLRWFSISDSTLIHSCSMFMQPWYTVSDICWRNTFSKLYSPTYSLLKEVEWFIMSSLSCSHVQWTLDYVLWYNVLLHVNSSVYVIWAHHVTHFLFLAAAVNGQSHNDDSLSQSCAVTLQRAAIPSQELKAPVPSKSDKSSPTAAGDHTTHIH